MIFELFSIEGEHPRAAKAIVRRFILWSIVCWVSAGPAFGLALSLGSASGRGRGQGPGFNPWAMAAAITLFSILYTIFTSTDAFDRFHRIRGMRRTLYIGYWTRMAISIVVPISLVVDMVTGIFSVGIVARFLHTESGFVGTFLITCVHGTLMNLIIAVYMAIVYPIVRSLTRDPQRPGFEVILPSALPAETLPPNSSAISSAAVAVPPASIPQVPGS